MKRSLAVVLSAQLVASGCATVNSDIARTRPPEGASGPGSVRVSVFEKRSDLSAGTPSAHPVVSTLSRLENGGLVKVHESRESTWSLSDIPPGKYVFAVTRWTDSKGKESTDGIDESFNLSPGENARISVVLKDRRRNAAVTTAAVVGGAGLVGYVVYSLARAFSFRSLNLSSAR